jgi:hypothetical protein
MADPLKIKTEKALVGYLATVSALSGWTGYRGIRGDKQVLPFFVVECVKLDPAFEDRECNLFHAEVNVVLKSRVSHNSSGNSDTAEAAHFTAVEGVKGALFASLVRPFVNSENVVNRPVTVFHCGNFSRPHEVYGFDREEQAFMTVLRIVRIPVEANDGDGDLPLALAIIAANGATITLHFTEAMTVSQVGGWELTMSGGASTMTYASGSGSSALVYTLSRTIGRNETGTLAFVPPPGVIVDGDLNQLLSFSGFVVANQSTL